MFINIQKSGVGKILNKYIFFNKIIYIHHLLDKIQRNLNIVNIYIYIYIYMYVYI